MDPNNGESIHGYSLIEPLKRDIEVAYAMVADHNYHDAINLLTQLLQVKYFSFCIEYILILTAFTDILISNKFNSQNFLVF